MQKRRFYHLLAPTCLPLCFLAAAPGPVTSGDGIVLLDRDNPDYAVQNISPAITSYPEASLRLLVFRDDSIVFNHGLRDSWSRPRNPAGSQNGRPLFEGATVTEAVELSPDGLTAVIMETRIAPTNRSGTLEGDVGITWIDPENPRGRWSQDLPPGRFVSHIHVLDRQSGFALMTATPDGVGADFTLYGTEGDVEYHLDEVVGKVLDFRITRAGAFIGLDIAYPARPDLPDRTILILDRLQNAQWHYAWTYGDSAEPTGWTLMDNGVLEVLTPGKSIRYDRTGTPIIPSNRKRRQKRVRD
jgi:hypothetical protein